MNFYDFSAKKMNGQEVRMEEYKGKVVKRYSPTTEPLKIKDDILKLLNC